MQGFIVGPTWKPPFFWFKRTLFTKKLFPVLYFPTIETIASFLLSGKANKNYSASSLSLNPFPYANEMKGIAKTYLFFEFIDEYKNKCQLTKVFNYKYNTNVKLDKS